MSDSWDLLPSVSVTFCDQVTVCGDSPSRQTLANHSRPAGRLREAEMRFLRQNRPDLAYPTLVEIDARRRRQLRYVVAVSLLGQPPPGRYRRRQPPSYRRPMVSHSPQVRFTWWTR